MSRSPVMMVKGMLTRRWDLRLKIRCCWLKVKLCDLTVGLLSFILLSIFPIDALSHVFKPC